MNRMKAILMASAAAFCLIGASPLAAQTTGTPPPANPQPSNPPATTPPANPQTANSIDSSGKVVEVPVKNSEDNYSDDKMLWDDNVAGWSNLSQSDPVYCIPKGVTLVGKDSDFTPDPNNSSSSAQKKYLRMELGDGYFFGLFRRSDQVKELVTPGKDGAGNVVDPALDRTKHTGDFYLPVPPDAASICPTVKQPQALYDGQDVYVDSVNVLRADYRAGWDYGALAIPFKVQLSGKQSFSGSASLGGYLGYRFPFAGVVLRPVVFAGVSNISTSATTGGTTTSQTVAGLSYGFGLLTTIKGSLQAGLVLGFDHVDSAQPYAYNDKPWLSLEIGYSFAQ
jgi:hypothetical protein